MDKLQPLIKHRYWICFALSVIFVLVGWWMASGAIAVEILARKDSVDKSFDKAKQGISDPNQFWVEGAKKENEADAASYKSASAQLLQRQKDARRWPVALQKAMEGISYRADMKDSLTRARWASEYRGEIDRLLSIVKPYDQKTGEGLVVVDAKKVTHEKFDKWRFRYPSSSEVWNAQEDIWLLQSLLTSIARVNEGATRITEAQVRQIYKLHLRGGDRNAAPASSGGGMGGMGMGGEFMGGAAMVSPMMGAESMGGGMPGGAGGGSAAGQLGNHPGKSFEGSSGSDILTEEFGAAAGAGNAMGGMGGMGMPGEMGMGAMAMGGMGGGGEMGAPAEEKRYVDEGDQLGYKTRAFLLDVLVRDDQLPNLLASLTNSDFPVEIVRVEISSRSSSGGRNMTGMPGGGAGGMEMGMPGEMMGGMGAGMAEFGGAADLYGGAGEMESDLGGGAEYPGGELSIYGGGADPAMGMPGGMMGVNPALNRGKEAMQAAMVDPLLVYVKIGGLMTLYQSAQEADAEAATAEIDQAAAPTPAPAGEGVDPNAPAVDPADPNMTDASGEPGAPTAAAEGTAAATDPAAPADAAAGTDPATGTEPAADPNAPPSDAPKEDAPAEGTPTPDPAAEGTPTTEEAPAEPGTEAPSEDSPASETPASEPVQN